MHGVGMGWPWVLLLPPRSTNTATFRAHVLQILYEQTIFGGPGKTGETENEEPEMGGGI